MFHRDSFVLYYIPTFRLIKELVLVLVKLWLSLLAVKPTVLANMFFFLHSISKTASEKTCENEKSKTPSAQKWHVSIDSQTEGYQETNPQTEKEINLCRKKKKKERNS